LRTHAPYSITNSSVDVLRVHSLLHLHSFPTRRSSDLNPGESKIEQRRQELEASVGRAVLPEEHQSIVVLGADPGVGATTVALGLDRKSTRLNSSHVKISYAVFCL